MFVVKLPLVSRSGSTLSCMDQQHNKQDDNNLTIMESPKPATDNRFKNKSKATFEIFRCRESIQVIIIYLLMKFR